jgi:hypothetical protein
MEFLQWLEQTSLSIWIRESPSIWAFPMVLLLHTTGMAMVVGISAGIDLRILGFAPALKLSSLQRFLPILWTGFVVNAITGTLLVMQDARTKLTNPDFYVKLVFIAVALVTLRLLKNQVFGNAGIDERPVSGSMKLLAVVSMFCWLGAITAGRLLAYIGPVSGLE